VALFLISKAGIVVVFAEKSPWNAKIVLMGHIKSWPYITEGIFKPFMACYTYGRK
jgi:hypothetical protein